VCGPPGLDQDGSPRVVSGRLENEGPFGNESVATSNRAELRAAIAALRLQDWRNKGFDSLVLATDSSYVVDGATGWVKGWTRNGWKTRNGGDVKNRDLWDLLLGEVERWEHLGLRVELWNIPRELNGDADSAAKQVVNEGADVVEFTDIVTSPSQRTTAGTEPGHRILAICLENQYLLDAVPGGLVSLITSSTKMERATTQEAAMGILDQEPPPSVILLFDTAVTHQRNVLERVIDRLREGATVVLTGGFSSLATEGEFNRFFAKLGLSWERGSYTRTTVSLRSNAVSSRYLTSHLRSSCSQKAVFVKNVERSAAWYTSSDGSGEAAVALTNVGNGKLGYIGDVNEEEPSNMVVLAMCGLLG
jgi:ribonuclease HI